MKGRSWDEADREITRALVLDGAWVKAMEAVTSGVVLAGLALHLGAGPFLIGAVAASPFFAQLAQFLGLRVVFAVRERRRVSLVAALASRLLLAGVGLIALAGPSPWALPALLALLSASGALSAVSAVSWAFWMRDLIPQHVYGERFARRFSAQALMSVLFTLLAGVGLSFAAARGEAGLGFVILFVGGAACGVVSLLFAARLPEVPLNPADSAASIRGLVTALVADPDRRAVAVFLVAWTFAAFLGVPFITVYLLREVGLGFALVSALAAVAMTASLVTFRFWGRSVDRHGAAPALTLAIPAAAVCMALLVSAAGPAPWRLAGLGLIFAASGAAFAAIDIAAAKLVARQAPFTGAGTFLAGAGMVRAVAAGAATLLGGAAASALAGRELRFTVAWDPWAGDAAVSGYAFLFLASALLMLYAWHRVLALRSAQAGDVGDVVHEAQVELAGLAPFRGVRVVGHFAGHLASHMLEHRHRSAARTGAGHLAAASPAQPTNRVAQVPRPRNDA